MILARIIVATYMQRLRGPAGRGITPSKERPLLRIARSLALVVVTALLAIGCSDSSTDPGTDGGVSVADLVGSWTASSHTFTNNANSSESYDIIANGGETRTTVLTGGGARIWIEFGTFSDEWDVQLSISGTTLTATPAEATRETVSWTFALVGNTLTLTRSDSEFDFTLTGAAGVPATEVIVFVRN